MCSQLLQFHKSELNLTVLILLQNIFHVESPKLRENAKKDGTISPGSLGGGLPLQLLDTPLYTGTSECANREFELFNRFFVVL